MYDPTDERLDELFSLLLRLLNETPTNLAKQSLARLFEQTALAQVLLAKRGVVLDPETAEEALAEHWDEVEALRNELAADALNAIQTQEF
jgi:hypothetical protein